MVAQNITLGGTSKCGGKACSDGQGLGNPCAGVACLMQAQVMHEVQAGCDALGLQGHFLVGRLNPGPLRHTGHHDSDRRAGWTLPILPGPSGPHFACCMPLSL